MLKDKSKLPEVMVFAGPNGSGKTTITKMAKIVGIYINADDIKLSSHCTDMEAAKKAEKLRNKAIDDGVDFSFETVLSTRRNLDLLHRAKECGYFVRGIYVLTRDPRINISRIHIRQEAGGHGVPEDKIVDRYNRALKLIPELVKVCDILHVYDNTVEPFRIFKKRKDEFFRWSNDVWNEDDIIDLTGVPR